MEPRARAIVREETGREIPTKAVVADAIQATTTRDRRIMAYLFNKPALFHSLFFDFGFPTVYVLPLQWPIRLTLSIVVASNKREKEKQFWFLHHRVRIDGANYGLYVSPTAINDDLTIFIGIKNT